MRRGKDYSGNRNGTLTLISYVRAGGSGVGPIWMARCDCGKMLEVKAIDVTHGRKVSCGECQAPPRLTPKSRRTDAWIRRQIYASLVAEIVKAGGKVDMGEEEFAATLQSPCALCGSAPSQKHRLDRRERKLLYTLPMRVDSNKPLIQDNCLPVCRDCRQWIGPRNLLDFLIKVKQIASRLPSP